MQYETNYAALNDSDDILSSDTVRGILSGLKDTILPGKYFPIIDFIARDTNYNLDSCYIMNDRLFMEKWTDGGKMECMLRFNSGFLGYKKCIVVARIEFINKRCGNMSNLYQILKKYQAEHSTGPIVIESIVSDEMRSWCAKYGFVETVPCTFIEHDAESLIIKQEESHK